MRLKGEEADWVDEQLQAEVDSGQLARGNSEWASPPFATKQFAEHRRQRKRRLVVDYRRVNQRILRAVYHVRSADSVVQSVAGSAAMSFVDACKGFNQVGNTTRAKKVLAILARSGQFLPQCLTFGPCNGPEDFAFATDRIFAPGRGRKMRFCTSWQIYADDSTVRTGRVLEGTIYTDEEYATRTKRAVEERKERQQPLPDAFRELGFDPEGLGDDNKKPPKAKGRVSKKTERELAAKGLGPAASSDPSPYAHSSTFRVFDCLFLVWIAGIWTSCADTGYGRSPVQFGLGQICGDFPEQPCSISRSKLVSRATQPDNGLQQLRDETTTTTTTTDRRRPEDYDNDDTTTYACVFVCGQQQQTGVCVSRQQQQTGVCVSKQQQPTGVCVSNQQQQTGVCVCPNNSNLQE